MTADESGLWLFLQLPRIIPKNRLRHGDRLSTQNTQIQLETIAWEGINISLEVRKLLGFQVKRERYGGARSPGADILHIRKQKRAFPS